MTYKGISFYQSSYGIAAVEKVVLAIKDRDSPKEMTVPAQMGTRTEIPGSSSAFLLAQFLPDFQGMGPAFQVISFEPNRPHENLWIFQNHHYAFARIENYIKDQLVRRLSYSNIENVQGIWTARQLEMSDLRRGSRTRLTLDRLQYNVAMKDDDFTLQAIRRQ